MQRGLGGSPHERLPWFPRGLQRCSAVLGRQRRQRGFPPLALCIKTE
ncbi:MAG: hypothetical protein F6K52_06670 [Moorea sp. SIO3H5]|nr:hypothetical protein [Moorena sp. SIO3H5]